MSVIYPNKLPILNDEEFSVERPVSSQAGRKLVQAINMISRLIPIGEVKAFAVNNIGVKIPSGDLYQYCDGSEITNPLSPLRSSGVDSYFTPDMRDRFLRGGDNSTTIGNEAAGNHTIDLSHTHNVSVNSERDEPKGEPGDEQLSGLDHIHIMNSDLSDSQVIDPAHLKVVFYMKVS